MMAVPQRRTALTEAEIASIVSADSADPFALLGLHPLGSGPEDVLEIRSFCPGALSAAVVPLDGQPARSMHKVHEDGLFVWISEPGSKPFGYALDIRFPDGSTWKTPDPYCFMPQLGELDLHLFSEGNHLKLYDVMGAQPRMLGEVGGTLFSVWAPNASQISVIGDFNFWDRRRHPMRSRGSSGVWELFVPGVGTGALYKFSVRTREGQILEKADPLARRCEFRPSTASVVEGDGDFGWTDSDWMKRRAMADVLQSPMSIYEVHAPSWKRPDDGRQFLGWRELADQLIPWVTRLGFTHIELLPIMEHPFDGSWGYQTLGYFAPTSRMGSPADFALFVDSCHRAGLGVILDWTPAHFPNDSHGLARFDGTALYEHADPRLGRHPDWDTMVFNYGRNEVRGFLRAAALYWLDRFHVDGLRVDAVASMLYLDYSRKPGEWVPNKFGGRENLDAVGFLKDLNESAHGLFPGVVVIAEESTSWPAVSRPVWLGGLGFTLKWNMGWMHDTLRFFSLDPVFRKFHTNDLTFSLLYAFAENFVLPLSHDEVVHGKSSLLGKMPGDDWRKFAGLRLLYAYQWAHPGKKLLFMGCEIGQWDEWDHDSELDWALLAHERHKGLSMLLSDLNREYRSRPALWQRDCSYEGFRWIDFSDVEQTVVAFRRIAADGREVICVFNFTPLVRTGYRLGVPFDGDYLEVLNTDSTGYGGSGQGNLGRVSSKEGPWHGLPFYVDLTLPPLGALYLVPEQHAQKPANG
jgi:1,4-alpha-glucan branching enzyme